MAAGREHWKENVKGTIRFCFPLKKWDQGRQLWFIVIEQTVFS